MAEALLKTLVLTAEEYLQNEKQTPVKHEFLNGIVYAMGGASDKHGIISGNIFASIHAQLPESCDIFMSDMKVHANKNNKQCFYYPDILVSCDSTDNNKYFREKPILIVEVLSPSTERIDRTEKRERYQLIPELQEYVLIAQEYPKVEIYRRSNAWRVEEYFIEHSFRLNSVDMEFQVTDLYRRIKF